MRARYFRIIFFVLTVVGIGATLLHGLFLRQDRQAQIDRNIREAAAALLTSDINVDRQLNYQRIEDTLSEVLQGARIGKLFLIRDSSGNKLYESVSAKLLPLPPIPTAPQWITYQTGRNYVRILNLPLPRVPDRIVQIGLLLDPALISPPLLSLANGLFVGCIFLLGLAVAWGLTSTLMNQISRLVDHISTMAEESAAPFAPIPSELKQSISFFHRNDELARLIGAHSGLMAKLERQQKVQRAWSYQMAHELKTPLAILEGVTSDATRSGEIPYALAEKILHELMEASETVTAFLTWAELEGQQAGRNLYAYPMRKTLGSLAERLSTRYPARIEIDVARDFFVLAGLQHVEHALLNLVQNALHYSTGPVRLSSSAAGVLTVRDAGPGIPRSVLERLGDPFNRGRQGLRRDGHGLGLAYVHSVCRLYDWKLDIDTRPGATAITLRFPSCDETPEAELPDMPLEKPAADLQPDAY